MQTHVQGTYGEKKGKEEKRGRLKILKTWWVDVKDDDISKCHAI